MGKPELAALRRHYLRAFLHRLKVIWPVLSGLLGVMAMLGVVIGLLERWGVADGIYFAYVTGLTIGYGDLAPSRPVTRILAILIGLLGIIVTGLVAGIAVSAFHGSSMLRDLAAAADRASGNAPAAKGRPDLPQRSDESTG